MLPMQATTKRRDFQSVLLFTLIVLLYSWPIFFVVDAWLVPMFVRQNNMAGKWLTALFGHMLAMGGPALVAIVMWRLYHKEPLPTWKWSHPKYYVLVVLALLTLRTLPALISLAFSDTLTLRSPIESFHWMIIVSSFTLYWLAGLGEEVGWVAYLLPRLAPHIGKSRALVVAGAIRGIWHWPVLIGPVIAQVIYGEETVGSLAVLSVVFAFQLVMSNALFGALFGWVWYRTESLPLMGWLHQWFDAARDVTAIVVVGYSNTMWFTGPFGANLLVVLAGGLALTQVAREEGANMWTLAPPKQRAENRTEQEKT